MYRVLIVDDEILLRTKLKMLFEGGRHGFEICGEAVNGQDALELIEKTKPEIVISDVMMPVMDGIRLSSELSKRFPQLRLIVLSNFDEFIYVKTMMQNGALDYILKYELEAETLFKALDHARDLIESSRKDKYPSELSQSVSTDNMTTLRERFLVRLLTGVHRNQEEIRRHFAALDIRLDVRNVLVILMAIDDYRASVDDDNLKDRSLLEYAVVNIVQEILSDSDNGISCHVTNEKFLIMLSFDDTRSRAKTESRISSTLGRISQCLKEFLNLSVSFSICESLIDITEVPESFEKAKRHMKDRFYKGNSSILRSSPLRPENVSLEGLDLEVEREILSCIRSIRIDELTATLIEIFDGISRRRLSFTSYQLIFSDLLGIITRTCKDHAIELTRIYSADEAPHRILSKLETIQETQAWFISLFARLLGSLEKDQSEAVSPYVKQAVSQIRLHFAEDLSLSQVAEPIGISPSYLSTLFKEEIGKGFSDYLIQTRLDEARHLLDEGRMNLKEIVGACGFRDYSYFIKTFRSRVGVTPKEYMTRIR